MIADREFFHPLLVYIALATTSTPGECGGKGAILNRLTDGLHKPHHKTQVVNRRQSVINQFFGTMQVM